MTKKITITKITAMTKEEKKENFSRMKRDNKISETLNSCFEPNSLDQEDEETIIEWACRITNPRNLIYTLEKVKFKELKNMSNLH